MFLKVLCFAILVCYTEANDQLLNVLYGVHGLNKMSICMGPVNTQVAPLAPCPGALWRRQWVATRASCVTARPANALSVLRVADGVTCDNIYAAPAGEESPYLYKVRVQFVHPKYIGSVSPQYNLALLALDSPYETSDPLDNSTVVHDLLAEYATWMEEVYQKTPRGTTLLRSYMQRGKTFTTPMRMFITTVVLPSTCFIVFFLFLTFFTSPKNKTVCKDFRFKEEITLM